MKRLGILILFLFRMDPSSYRQYIVPSLWWDSHKTICMLHTNGNPRQWDMRRALYPPSKNTRTTPQWMFVQRPPTLLWSVGYALLRKQAKPSWLSTHAYLHHRSDEYRSIGEKSFFRLYHWRPFWGPLTLQRSQCMQDLNHYFQEKEHQRLVTLAHLPLPIHLLRDIRQQYLGS